MNHLLLNVNMPSLPAPRISCQLELHHYQSLPSQFSSAGLLPSCPSVLNVIMLLNQYQRQLLPGVLCINMDLQGSFKAGVPPAEGSKASVLPLGGALTLQELPSPS